MQILNFRFPLGKVFSCQAGDVLAQAMKVRADKGKLVKALSNRLPCVTTAHKSSKMPIPVGTQGSSCYQQFRSFSGWCIA